MEYLVSISFQIYDYGMHAEVVRGLVPVYQAVKICKDANITDFYNSSGTNMLLIQALVSTKNYSSALDVMNYENTLVSFQLTVENKHKILLQLTIYENLDMIDKATDLWISSIKANLSSWADFGTFEIINTAELQYL